MDRIVAGVDGSAAGASALQWAGRLAAITGAEVLAVHAYQNPWSEVSPDEHRRLMEDREDTLARAWVKPAVETGASVRTLTREGDPRQVLLAVADTEQADLVVLGRTGRGGGPGFLHLGSAVEHVAHHTMRPLAVIPVIDSSPIEKIVLGVDGSAESAVAVEWCMPVAVTTAASVVAVSVEEPILEWTSSTSPVNWRRDVEHNIRRWVAPLTEKGISVEAVAQRDLHPADGLLGVASAHAGDVLVIGTRGAGGFTGLRAGGVAMKVLHRASLPLVLVPKPG